jgi:hypothetical protein
VWESWVFIGYCVPTSTFKSKGNTGLTVFFTGIRSTSYFKPTFWVAIKVYYTTVTRCNVRVDYPAVFWNIFGVAVNYSKNRSTPGIDFNTSKLASLSVAAL